MNNTSELNSTSAGAAFSFQPSFVYPVATCHILIVLVAIVGNLMVCYAILANKSLRSIPTNLFIFSLAFSDLLTVTLAVPFDIEGLFLQWVWKHGEIMCKAWITVYLIAVPTSILTLLAVSVDRYKSLSDPLNRFRRCRFMTRRRALIISIVIWLYSLLFALLPIMGWRTEDKFVYMDVCYFPFTLVYMTISSSLNFILPLLITCGIYIKIYLIARRQHNNFDGNEIRKLRSTEEKKAYSRNVQAAKTISIFVGAFFCCWVPYSSVSIVATLCEPCAAHIPYEARIVLLMFGYLNSALNPFLFAFRNNRFKATYTSVLRLRTLKPRPTATSGFRRSTLTQSTLASDIPDLQDSVVRLHSAKSKRDSLAAKRQSEL
ncbi:5-hydroxytryptamine receptor 1F [Desmophyllum pertusum]|uniref:5-hydroxytryptamine receptor 1F n=1 Tax=Desmophyllum pertusum TaxID=174260 RepID=A0A9X0CFB5_9CNID|nr:5-hydroxytryptamine receptor 1F [Desmophyllum pertusum]